MVTQTIRVNLNQKDLETILAVQSDTLREIAFEFYATDAEDAVQLDPDEFTVKFNVLKPDNNFVMTTFTDGVIKLSDQITAVTGTGYYCILLMQDDELIYSGNGKIIINDHVIGTENIDSVSEADGYTFPDDFYTKDTPLAVLDDSTTSTTSTWSSTKIAEEIASIPGADIIDDTVTSTEKTWSSSKISEEVAAAAASEIDDNTTGTDSTWSSEKIADEISEVTPIITKEVTGNPIEFSDGADAPLVKCTTEIQGSQDLHGYDKPWAGGSGKNKAKQTVDGIKARNSGLTWVGNTTTVNNGTVTILTDNADNVIGYKFNGNFTREFLFSVDDVSYVASENVIVSGCPSGSPAALEVWRSGSVIAQDTGSGVSVNAGSMALVIRVPNNASMSNLVYTPMICLSTESDSTFAPYSNICPITAYTEGEIEVSDGDGNTTTHTTTYPSAIYRGSEDCVKGTVTTEWGMIASYAEETLPGEWISDRDEYAPGTTPTTGAQVAYALATPTTSTVSPTNQPIKSLSGYNHIESSTGEMEVEYIVDEYQPIIDCIPAGPIYSTDEQITGTWTDGRPVYTRIIPVNATWQNIGTTSRQSFVYLQDWAKQIDLITDLFIIGKDQYYGYTFNAAANLDRGYGTIEACWNDPFGGALTSVPVECVRISYVKTASVSRNLQRISDVNEVKELQDPVLEERREEEYEDEVHDQEMSEPGTYDTNRE